MRFMLLKAMVECLHDGGVRVFAGQIDPLDDLHLPQVKNVDRALCAEIRALEFGSERDGVRVMRFVDVGKLLSTGVHHENMSTATGCFTS